MTDTPPQENHDATDPKPAEPETSPEGARKIALLCASLLAGSMLFLSFAGWDIWPLGFIFVLPLLWIADNTASAKQAFRWSLLTGWIANFGGFYWITNLLMDFGQMPSYVAIVLSLLLSLVQGFSFAFFGAIMHRLRKRTSLPTVVLAPLVWVCCEFLMPLIFPYYLGNSQYLYTPMIQIAELFGPLSVSAVLFISNGALYDALYTLKGPQLPEDLRRKRFIGAGVGVALVVLNIVYGYIRIAQVEETQTNAPKLKIGMAEADIGIFAKEDPKKIANNLIIHQKLSQTLEKKDNVDLIVWPESSYQTRTVWTSRSKSSDPAELEASAGPNPPGHPRRAIPRDATWMRPGKTPLVDDASIDRAQNAPWAERVAPQRGFSTPLLMGAITYRVLSDEEMKTNPPSKKRRTVGPDGKVRRVPRNYRVYNSAVLLDENGFVKDLYDKNYLLVFGEYIPFSNLWPKIYDLIPAASEFTPGEEVRTFDFKGHKLGLMICYEDIIPAFGRRLAQEDPNVIINVTNDAWFGKTHEPYLHLALATFRTVETRKWLLRSTNTGVSAFIDATGNIVRQTSIYEPEAISYDVAMMPKARPLYITIGDLIGWLALLGTVVLWWRTRETKPEESGAKES